MDFNCMLNIVQFRELIVKPTLKDLLMDSPEAEELLIFTCANESLGGTYLRQLVGTALGIFQMEPATHNDIWRNYIYNNTSLNLILTSNFQCHYIPYEERLIYDLRYATAMARIYYKRVAVPLPSKREIGDIWEYYNNYYNTSKEGSNKEQSINNYYRFLQTQLTSG
jgi:hypothetical protein